MYSASIWTVVFRTSTGFKNWVLPICVPPPCPVNFKIWSLHASNILRPFHNGDCFPFFRVCDVFFIFCSDFFLDWTWVSKLWKLMAPQATTVQKKFLYKTKDPGPACIDMPWNSSTIKSETRYPNIKGPHVSIGFVKPPFWRSWFYSGPGEWP